MKGVLPYFQCARCNRTRTVEGVYKCGNCDTFSLCSQCFLGGGDAEHNIDHVFVALMRPKHLNKYFGTQTLLSSRLDQFTFATSASKKGNEDGTSKVDEPIFERPWGSTFVPPPPSKNDLSTFTFSYGDKTEEDANKRIHDMMDRNCILSQEEKGKWPSGNGQFQLPPTHCPNKSPAGFG